MHDKQVSATTLAQAYEQQLAAACIPAFCGLVRSCNSSWEQCRRGSVEELSSNSTIAPSSQSSQETSLIPTSRETLLYKDRTFHGQTQVLMY